MSLACLKGEHEWANLPAMDVAMCVNCNQLADGLVTQTQEALGGHKYYYEDIKEDRRRVRIVSRWDRLHNWSHRLASRIRSLGGATHRGGAISSNKVKRNNDGRTTTGRRTQRD